MRTSTKFSSTEQLLKLLCFYWNYSNLLILKTFLFNINKTSCCCCYCSAHHHHYLFCYFLTFFFSFYNQWVKHLSRLAQPKKGREKNRRKKSRNSTRLKSPSLFFRHYSSFTLLDSQFRSSHYLPRDTNKEKTKKKTPPKRRKGKKCARFEEIQKFTTHVDREANREQRRQHVEQEKSKWKQKLRIRIASHSFRIGQ